MVSIQMDPPMRENEDYKNILILDISNINVY